ncbi:MAG: cyclic nucleotide-binding/CBS domain-containing protein [bacterium]
MENHSDYLLPPLREWLEIGDVMTDHVVRISSDKSILDAANLMAKNNISCLVVSDNGNLTGILTETDFLHMAVDKGSSAENIKVREMMTSPVMSIPENMSVIDASRIMQKENVKRLPVTKGKRLVGIITQTDLTRVLTSYNIWDDVMEIMNENIAKIYPLRA